jgi:predicted MPP superfamily phosphohydrolase
MAASMRPFPHDPLWTRYRPSGSAEWLGADLVVRRFTVSLPGAGTRPFRLAFFADLHWNGEPAGRLRRLIDTVNAADVGAVVFGGDLAAHLVHLPAALSQLARLTSTCVRIAVRGNRESACDWLSRDFWRQRFAQVGFLYLQNETWVHPGDPGAPAIVGLDDHRHGSPDFAVVAQAAAGGRPVLAVTHNPDAVGHRGSIFLGHLVLSGHTHGGQYRLPWLGAVFTSSRYWRQFDRGWRRRQDGTLLYVTAGAGETGSGLLRRRLFCPPELALITLEAAAPAAGQEAP